MGLKKHNLDEQWLVLVNPGTQAATVDRAIGIAEFGEGARIANVYATLSSSGNGDMVVEVKKNGTTLFGAGANKIKFASGETVGGVVDPISDTDQRVLKGDRFTLDVNSVPGGPGSGLSVHIQILRHYRRAAGTASPAALP